LKNFILVDLEEYEPFKLLQSLDDDEMSLIVTSPYEFFDDYEIKLSEETIENLKKVKLFPQSKVLNMSAEQYLTASSDKFDIVFMDPPYNNNTVNKILPNLFTRLNENAVVFCETELTAELPQSLGNLEKQKTYKYGKVLVTKYIFKS
ncbi:MAG: RsmD family RNA methyltransferase, partial [Oscillospiraceae bacterium]